MKKLSIEEKAKAYDEAIKRAQKWHDAPNSSTMPTFANRITEEIFPELAETNDERIRKWLIGYFQRNEVAENIKTRDIIAWLEKQGEQKSADKVEPKFNAGDWTVSNLDGKARQISEVHFDEYNSYYVVDGKSVNLKEYDRLHHLWTIQDAKDGDVLTTHSGIVFIFENIVEGGTISFYAALSTSNFASNTKIHIPDDNEQLCDQEVFPATKEQRELLFTKMKEAGYEWDAEKKELKKIEQKKNIHNKLTDFEYSLKHIMEEAIECGDTHNLKADADMLLSLAHKSAWSEEDEDYINDLIKYFSQNERLENTKEDIVIWLKSLKTHSIWKPSDEQIEALKKTIHLKPFENPSDSLLWGLYEQLKKLKN